MRKVDLKLDEATALKLADIILVQHFGDEEAGSYRPWKANDEGTYYHIYGTLPPLNSQGKRVVDENMKYRGGTPEVKISKATAEVLAVLHSK